MLLENVQEKTVPARLFSAKGNVAPARPVWYNIH